MNTIGHVRTNKKQKKALGRCKNFTEVEKEKKKLLYNTSVCFDEPRTVTNT